MEAEKILGLRKALGCTQEEFSKILGVTAVALSRWETGKAVPQGRNVAQLAKSLSAHRRDVWA